MSYVSTVVIQVHDYEKEDEALIRLNRWLEDNGHLGERFNWINGGLSAGTKSPERKLLWGGFNYLDIHGFTVFFKSLNLDNSLLTITSGDSETYNIISSNSLIATMESEF